MTSCTSHDSRAVCWLCSNLRPWWRAARIKAGQGEEPPNAPETHLVICQVPDPIPAAPTRRRHLHVLDPKEMALVRMLRAVAKERGVSVAALSDATRRSIATQVEQATRRGVLTEVRR